MKEETEYKQKAEAIFPFSEYASNPNCNYDYIIEKMLSFHKELLKETKTIECYVPCIFSDKDIAGYMQTEAGALPLKATTLTVLQSEK